MSQLFTPLDLGHLTLPNRITVAPMCQYNAQDGCAGDWHMIHLGHLALSGAGLLTLEATAVSAVGRITPHCLGLYTDDNQVALDRVLSAIRETSSIPIAIQLAHAGRKGSSRTPFKGGAQIRSAAAAGWVAEAPSAAPYAPDDEPPAALDAAGLERVKAAFVQAAERAARLHLDGIELHMAHGYLLHQFLSPISNRRNDAYGGDLDGRMRFPLEVFRAVRAAAPSRMPVWVRVSATDWVEGGWTVEETAALGLKLKEAGCAALHVSSGGLSPDQQISIGPGYQVPMAAALKDKTGLPTIAVGLITEPKQAEEIVASGQADAVALARGLLWNPRWPWHAAAELGAEVEGPKQYWRSAPHGVTPPFAGFAHGQR